LDPDKVRRTILFVLTTWKMNYLPLQQARKAVTKFVENEMQQGDMVAITKNRQWIQCATAVQARTNSNCFQS